jgi:hypothetical protein
MRSYLKERWRLRSRKLRLTTVGDPTRRPRDTALSTKVSTKFRREVFFLFSCLFSSRYLALDMSPYPQTSASATYLTCIRISLGSSLAEKLSIYYLPFQIPDYFSYSSSPQEVRQTDSQTLHTKRLPEWFTSRLQPWSANIKHSAIPRIFETGPLQKSGRKGYRQPHHQYHAQDFASE